MTRFAIVAVATLLAAVPAFAQTSSPKVPGKGVAASAPQAADPAPGSEAWLRLRGESYSAAPDTPQDPAEVAETVRLNAEIAARNNAAERREAEGTAAWQAEVARLETERAQWEADAAAAEAARQRYERDRAAWAAEVAACERTGRCLAPAPKS